MNSCGTLKGFQQHKAANTRCCKWCAPYDPRLANPKKQAVVRKKPGPKPKPKTVAQKRDVDSPRFKARFYGEIEHGSPWGYQQHKSRGDADCEPCRLAANARRKKMRDERKARELLAAT